MNWPIILSFVLGVVVGGGLTVLLLGKLGTHQDKQAENESVRKWEEGIAKSLRLAPQKWPDITNSELEVLEHIWRMIKPDEFEVLVGRLFEANGYKVEHFGKASGDDGIDLVASRNQERLIIQCKKYRLTNSVGHPDVRSLLGAMESLKPCCGVMVTSSVVAPRAQRLAADAGLKCIEGGQLVRNLVENGIFGPATALNER